MTECEKEIGIIGIGKIGSVLLTAILEIVEREKIIIYDVDEDVVKGAMKKFKVDIADNNKDLAKKSKYIFLAVIPQVIDEVLEEIGPMIEPGQTIISIAAGVPLSHIHKFVSDNVALIRAMPNTPALVKAGATVIAKNSHVDEIDLEYVKKLFETVGTVVELKEIHLDAVTGLSGSGPAYVFIIIEALADGGVKMGLSREVAQKLAAQTVLGAAKMVLETDKHPGELKDMVATPAGTTITAIHELESAKIRATLIRAVEAATLRSKSLK
ncbi:MAG: Pyrroline-5-carboxylate reductase [Promethearchaeota archaeon]|nr:MAG: Pyrroline-5-carboxylate reductase [Candidatus Lokiarchaeota archaeon]